MTAVRAAVEVGVMDGRRGLVAVLWLGLGGCADSERRDSVWDAPGLAPEEADTDATDDADTEAPDGTGGDADADAPEDVESGTLASGISIASVEVNQGVAVTVASQGAPVSLGSRNAEIIAERPTLIRAPWAISTEWTAREVEAHLEVTHADGEREIFVDRRRIAADAPVGMDAAFEWEMTGQHMRPAMAYRIRLLEVDEVSRGTATQGAILPASGTADLGVTADPMRMKLVVIPVVTPAGGVHVTPDLRELIAQRITASYPLQELDLVVRAPWTTQARLSSLDEAFDYMTQARAQDGAGHESYYHLLLDYDTCCSGEDFADWGGIAYLADETPDFPRDGITKIFMPDPQWWIWDIDVMIHEIGHNHGRDHAPCGNPEGVDPNFPYAGAGVGVPGYDIDAGVLIDPTSIDPETGMATTDFMSYCWPQWWSDYSWQNLLKRVRAMTQAELAGPPAPWDREVLRGVLRADGTTTWSRVPAGGSTMAAPPSAGTLTLRGADGAIVAERPVVRRRIADVDVTILEAELSHAPTFDRFEVDLGAGRRLTGDASSIRVPPAIEQLAAP
jgi:hypothetical protein